jgi:hypothetical protein
MALVSLGEEDGVRMSPSIWSWWTQHPGVGGHAIANSEDFRKATDYFGVLYDAAALALSAFTAEAIHLNPGNYTVRLSVPILSSSPHPYWIGLEIHRASIVSR